VGQRAVPDAMPPVTQLAPLVASRRAELLGLSPPLAHGVTTPRQMGPAALAPPGGIPMVPTPAVCDQPPPPSVSQAFLGHLAAARPPYDKDRAPGRDRRPQPRLGWPFTLPCVIQMRHRWLLAIAPGCRSRCRPRRHRGRRHVHHGAQTPRHPPPLFPAALGRPSRQLRRPRAPGRERLHARATSPRRHSWGQLGPGPLSAG
jgi:hypothetical protein